MTVRVHPTALVDPGARLGRDVEVGPFAYDVEMRTVDNHDRRDGTPDSFSFQGNFPPCVQCIELLNAETTRSIRMNTMPSQNDGVASPAMDTTRIT